MTYAFQTEIGDRVLKIETGRFAEQANGAVTVQYGDTVVLVTACTNPEPKESADFLPLTIDYEERLYAAGKIPGSFFRREGRPSTEAILACRVTDRPLRPLFPKDYRNETQVVVTVLSADMENDPDILAIIGASAALSISDIPFGGPVATCRIGYLDGQYVVNPTYSQLEQSILDLVVVGTRSGTVMVEGDGKEAPEDVVLGAIAAGQRTNEDVLKLQEELVAACGRPKKEHKPKEIDATLQSEVTAVIRERLGEGGAWKKQADRRAAVAQLKQEVEEKLGGTHSAQDLASAFDPGLKDVVRSVILERGIRPDGRRPDEIRAISCEVGAFPRTHGSGLFTRGQTQVLTIATLGSPGEVQQIDGIGQEESKRYMHHYNFPPFSNGEVKRLGSPGRREIGHGALAERALTPVLPDEADFPYTLRLVSEVLSSNGSTSMASVCGCTLALMDAGVPIKAPVAGIAMGLVMGEDGKYVLLTDIQGLEDALGDMDFKVAGTAEGITALQMDIKVKSVSREVLEDGLRQARAARLYVLERMKETIAASRPELSKYAPRLTKIQVDPDKIRHVIGPGGKMIRTITSEAKVTIDIENDGTILIGSPNEDATQKAIKMIEELTRDAEVGGTYTGRVTRLMNFGAFVEILPGKEGLVHISELAEHQVANVEEVVKVGDEVTVMVTEIDRMGRINLSRRAVFEKESGTPRAQVGSGPRSGPGYPPRRRPDSRYQGGQGGQRDRGPSGGGPRRPPFRKD